ncbi:methionyl-tRNA formyltransferase [Bacterioplanes sanyensis]|uniref:Methionyl-tRNA formyltransferase n=1 Tax=Bacterioplanes sanyensis TaxID=1249553 RepID=A0A222FGW1_9GAMM|nr:methionyl-tRNA formyltransferase [Bacterioplanes sanyensis]ASP37989.1 methionyl-tRNA formyltransferase [Bacterioplanes sanyensis]
MSLKLIFAGTPEFAADHLRALIASEHEIVAVYTQPDRPAKRGKKLQPSAVKQVALEHDLPVLQPLNFKDPQDIATLADHQADAMIVVAYGLLLPKAVLEAPKHGCLNVHASLLPRWRGAAPIQRCLEAGDSCTGITIMQMDEGLDTGDMLHKLTTVISQDDTGGSLHDRLAQLGPPALLDTLTALEQGQLQPEQQDDSAACYAHKLSKQEAQLDWTRPSSELALQVRAFNPVPMSYSILGNERIRIVAAEAIHKPHTLLPGTIARVDQDGVDVACDQGLLRLKHIQLAGKKAMSVAEIINGQPQLLQPNYVFSAVEPA